MSSAYTVSATEIGDMQNSYTTLSVEFSDNIGQYEDLDIRLRWEKIMQLFTINNLVIRFRTDLQLFTMTVKK